MTIWSGEIKELEKLNESIKANLSALAKELEQLLKTEDANVVMLYSRRCLEVIVTDLCEFELKRPRKTEPLKGIIDKLNSEEKVPPHIITSMHGLNSLSTYGTHPKDFDPEQVKPALSNLTIVIKWYLKYKESSSSGTEKDSAGIKVLKSDFSSKKEPFASKRRLSRLSTILVICIVAGASIIIGYFIFKKTRSIDNLEKTIAVLPFINDSRDSTTTIFMDGVMEEILNRLQAIKELTPISRSSVEQYRNARRPLTEIAQERHVNYIVEGSGQKYGDSIILRVQLIEIRQGRERHLMGKSFRQKLESASTFFNIQSDVAQSIASELNATITPQEKRLIEKLPTDNLDAYEAYLKGLFYLNKVTPDALDSAMHYFELAKEIDPGYALAYTGICNVWLYRQQMGFIKPSEGNPKSMEAVMKAYSLDSNNAVVQYTLANKKTYGMFDWIGGESGYKKSISLNPNNPMTHTNYSNLLIILGRPEESFEQIKIALKLDPMNPLIITFYGVDLFVVRKYNEAIKAYQDAMTIEPGYPLASQGQIWAYYFTRRIKEAYDEFKVAWSYDPELLQAAEQGYSEDGWKGLLISYNKLCEKRDTWPPSDIATNYALLGFNDKAMFWLERAYADHDPNLPYLLFPQFDSLRNDPRFQDLCRRLKLPYRMNL